MSEYQEDISVQVSNKAIILHACLIPACIGFITIWKPLFAKMNTKLSFNKKRISGEVGLIKKASMESPISKVKSVKVEQSMFGRMLNYGTLRINVAGDYDDYIFAYIDNPKKVKKMLLDFMDD